MCESDERVTRKEIVTMVLSVILVIASAWMILMEVFVWSDEREARQAAEHKVWVSQFDNGAIKIGENSFGCVRYQYFQDRFWKCPKDSGVTSIIVRKYKRTIEEPVVED